MRRRVTKQFYWQVGYVGGTWIQTNEVHYVYDGNLVVQERNASNVPQVTYTRGTDLSGSMQGAGGIGGLLARTDNPQTLDAIPHPLAHAFYHADGNGNITMLLYASGAVAAKYLYDPYGTTLAQSGPLADANSYRFSSKEWNQNSGLYYYLYRFYDPSLQRWPNRDLINEIGFKLLISDRAPFNLAEEKALYAFVFNDPVGHIDIDGRITKEACIRACSSTQKMASFCRKIPHPATRAGCWGVYLLCGEPCKNWCRWAFN